jgi:homoserine kinase
MKGEALASQCEHADNLAPAIFGGFTLVKSACPLQVLQLPTPPDLFTSLIHPQIEIKTSESRAILPKEIPLENAIIQWANVGSLVHALHTSDYDLIKDALNDVVIEPYRKKLIPHFDDVKMAVLEAGALGCAISGSGPSIFALSKSEKIAKDVENAMRQIYSKTAIEFEPYVSKINIDGIKTIK